MVHRIHDDIGLVLRYFDEGVFVVHIDAADKTARDSGFGDRALKMSPGFHILVLSEVDEQSRHAASGILSVHIFLVRLCRVCVRFFRGHFCRRGGRDHQGRGAVFLIHDILVVISHRHL